MTNVAEALSSLVERSIQLHEAIHDHVNTLIPYGELRFGIAFDSGVLALEHGTAALHLIEAGWTSSAFTLMRPQFESLVRGIWLAHAARGPLVFSAIWDVSEPCIHAGSQRAPSGNPHEYWVL